MTVFPIRELREHSTSANYPVLLPPGALAALLDAVEAAQAYTSHEQSEPNIDLDLGLHIEWESLLYQKEQELSDRLGVFDFGDGKGTT